MVEDLHAVTRQIRLDLLALRCSRALTGAGVPHALIKGVTTARWLYRPPRPYRDVDLLVPASRAPAAAAALVAAGLAEPVSGPGEEASHSWQLVSAEGAEVDLHLTLPTLRPDRGDRVWQVLAGHLEGFTLDGGSVPALEPPARAVLLAMHVIASGHEDERVREDLRRALHRLGPDGRRAAERIAGELGLAAHLAAATAFVHDGDWGGAPDVVRLRLSGASAATIQLAVARELGAAERVRWAWRELFPSNGFVERAYPESAGSRRRRAVARGRRLAGIAGSLRSRRR